MSPVENISRLFKTAEALEDFLRAEVKSAQSRKKAADLEFWRTCSDVSDPEHDERVGRAAIVQTDCRRHLLVALERLNAYLSHGTIPDDFRLAKAEQSSASA